MTAPKICEYCGGTLDAGETCDCPEAAARRLGSFASLTVEPEKLRKIVEGQKRPTTK